MGTWYTYLGTCVSQRVLPPPTHTHTGITKTHTHMALKSSFHVEMKLLRQNYVHSPKAHTEETWLLGRLFHSTNNESCTYFCLYLFFPFPFCSSKHKTHAVRTPAKNAPSALKTNCCSFRLKASTSAILPKINALSVADEAEQSRTSMTASQS